MNFTTERTPVVSTALRGNADLTTLLRESQKLGFGLCGNRVKKPGTTLSRSPQYCRGPKGLLSQALRFKRTGTFRVAVQGRLLKCSFHEGGAVLWPSSAIVCARGPINEPPGASRATLALCG